MSATTFYNCSICNKEIEFCSELVHVGKPVKINGIVHVRGYHVYKFLKTCKHNFQRNGYCYTNEERWHWYPKIKQDHADG